MPNRHDDDYFETDEFGEDIVPDRGDEPPPKLERKWHYPERWKRMAKQKASGGEPDKPQGRGRQFLPGVASRLLGEGAIPEPASPLPLKPQESVAPIVDPVPDDEDETSWLPNPSEEEARMLWENGLGGRPGEVELALAGIHAGTGNYSSLLAATYGEGGEGLGQGVKSWADLQRERPHLYVFKKRARHRSYRMASTLSSQGVLNFGAPRSSRYITSDEFVDLYSAVAFANRCGLIMNCHITILWAALGITDHDEVARALLGFTRRLRDWCAQRGFETAWIYSHENSPLAGLHSHVLLFVSPRHAKEFRAYALWSLNKRSRINPTPEGPKAVVVEIRNPRTKEVDIRRTRCIYVQWLWFEYLCKGIRLEDKFVELRRGPKETEQVYLSDLVRFSPQDPGYVECSNRVGMSRNLSQSCRARGFINEAVLTKAPKFKSGLEMLNRGVDVRYLYSARYYEEFLDQARALYSLRGKDFDKELTQVQGVAEIPAGKTKAVTVTKPVGVTGPRKRKRVLVPGRLKASAEIARGKGGK
jgi:hypothetical protein